MPQKYKRYAKKADYSFSFGMFSTIELVKNHPEAVVQIITDENPEQNSGMDILKPLARQNHIEIVQNPAMIKRIAQQDNHTIIGVFNKYAMQINPKESHIVLAEPSFTGNMGTIMRTAIGFGFKNIAIIRPAVDIFDPKTIRASMGALFSLNVQYFDSIEQYQETFKAHHLHALMLGSQKTLNETQFKKPYSLIFGNEGAGLDEKYRTLAEVVTIQHLPEIDSLNVSIAAGITMYEAFLQR